MPNYATVIFFFPLWLSDFGWEVCWRRNVNLTSSKLPNDNRCFRKSGNRKTAPIQGRHRGWCYRCYLYCANVDMLYWCMVCLCVPPPNFQIRTLPHWRKFRFKMLRSCKLLKMKELLWTKHSSKTRVDCCRVGWGGVSVLFFPMERGWRIFFCTK